MLCPRKGTKQKLSWKSDKLNYIIFKNFSRTNDINNKVKRQAQAWRKYLQPTLPTKGKYPKIYNKALKRKKKNRNNQIPKQQRVWRSN